MSLGLVAGEGNAPLYFLKALKKKDVSVKVITFSEEQRERISELGIKVKKIRLGQLGKLISSFKKDGVREVVFLGKIEKPKALREAVPDLRALLLWRRLVRRNDDSILRAVTEELEKEGLKVISPADLVPELLTPEGVLTKRSPTKEEWLDIRYGFEVAKKIGELDIGQCVVVKDGMVVAVEAMEGTDETIRRGGRLRSNAVVVKVFKPGQDPRTDLPAAGISTLKVMKEAGAKVLALEAKKTFFFEREEAVKFADQNDISVVGFKWEG